MAGLLTRFFKSDPNTKKKKKRRDEWTEKWADPDYDPPWLNRGVADEVIEAAESGWFPPGAPALDIGCGEGEIAAWMAEHGFPSLGFDIAPPAIERAKRKFPEKQGKLEFRVVDLCENPPPNWRYKILIDRGCIHQIPPRLVGDFVRNLLLVSAPDARLLVLMRAFREGQSIGDAEETERVMKRLMDAVGKDFLIEKRKLTWLDRDKGRNPETQMPGLAFWLKRKSG